MTFDESDPDSLSSRIRSKRFAWFERRLPPKPLRILDIGGTNRFRKLRGWTDKAGVQITLANLKTAEPKHGNIDVVIADATELPFEDMAFDMVFSNSTIEHLRTLDAQVDMAREVRRLAPRYWVQTPSYWFPFEPHFQVPGWQWLPQTLRVSLVQRHRFGHRGPMRTWPGRLQR